MIYISPLAIVEEDVSIGDGTKIWHFAQVREGAKIGRDCSIGKCAYIDKGVIIGDDVRIANDVSVYKGTIIKDGVFISKGVAISNVRKPHAKKKATSYLDTIIEDGVSIGINASIAGGVKIDKNAIVGEGAVVIGDVPADTFVAGNPARKRKISPKNE